jgi:hypothetical protein
LLAFHRIVSILLERRKMSAVNEISGGINYHLQQTGKELGA